MKEGTSIVKNSFKLLLLVISALLCFSLLTACNGNGDSWNPKGKDVTLIAKGEAAKYICIYSEGDDVAKNGALLFKSALNSKGLKCVPTVFAHTAENDEFELLFGATDRDASKIAMEMLESEVAKSKKDYHWVFYYREGKLAIVANNDVAYQFAIKDFSKKYITDNGVIFKDTLKEHGVLTEEEYDEYLTEEERIAAEEKKELNEIYLSDVTALLDAQRTELSTLKGTWNKYASANTTTNPELYLFMDYTEDMMAIANGSFGSPGAYPTKNEHPRLLLTKDNLPQIRKMLREDNETNAYFKSLVDVTLDNNGILPAASNKGTNVTLGGTLFHNHSEYSLIVIQAKALSYLLYNDEYYGYQAILYMKNYLKSLDIREIPSDQCRSYGYVARTAAIVYDWCYDLLEDIDKTQLIAGVENCVLQGSNKKGAKMEVGFPPSKQGVVEGHACEYQILRDYLSVAVAIYDEAPSWYEYIAGRIYNQFLPVRNYYYSNTGMVQQGMGYAYARYHNDLYAAWIFTVATGENPYDESVASATIGLINYEFAPGYVFNDGDKTGDWHDETFLCCPAYLHAYIYEDPDMLAMADYLLELRGPFKETYSELNAVSYVALRGLCKMESSEDRYGSMNLIQYNGSPLGQYIVRNSWGDNNAAAVFMRIKERSSGDHEHMDAGTFEIYYKGMLTSDGGCYNENSHNHTMYYHDATISHNGLMIYNPNLKTTDSGWYSGGQRRVPHPGYTLTDWLSNSETVVGTIIGRQHGYVDAEETHPLYAYIAGDITKAYHSGSVEYVGRRMLTVYTGSDEFPMVFFVFDDISANNKDYERRFLLQITSPEAPTIEGNTVITENGEGRLVLTCLSRNININGVGGRAYKTDGSYDAKNSKNYLVNGKQLQPKDNGRDDDGHWGRVEIVSTRRSRESTFMNVLYVTDKGNSNTADVRTVTNVSGVEGAIFNKKIAAIFATDRNGATETISFSTTANNSIDYYVSGLASGKWKVTVDGKDCGTYTVNKFTKGTYDKNTYLNTSKDSEGGLLTFKAPAGNVVITPVSIDK